MKRTSGVGKTQLDYYRTLPFSYVIFSLKVNMSLSTSELQITKTLSIKQIITTNKTLHTADQPSQTLM